MTGRYRRPNMAGFGDGWLSLLEAVFRGGPPKLTGAACAGQPDLFDAVTSDDARRAIELCQSCPVLDACADWARSHRHGQLTGVLGGRRYFSHRDAEHDEKLMEATHANG